MTMAVPRHRGRWAATELARVGSVSSAQQWEREAEACAEEAVARRLPGESADWPG
jgi:hypothetical protein